MSYLIVLLNESIDSKVKTIKKQVIEKVIIIKTLAKGFVQRLGA